jgi:PIN domain nuclease of toxin-antitoxin system
VKFLIDTDIWILMASSPERLGERTRRLLGNTRNELWLSPLSILELQQLERKGIWQSRIDVRTWIERSLKAVPMREAPITLAVALEAGAFELATGDPIDQLIVATAREMKIPLVTTDQAIIESGCVEVVPND